MMNEESTQLWLALLKEWLNELDCEDIAEYPTGFDCIYHDMSVFLKIDEDFETLWVCVSQTRYTDDFDMDLSEFDICNPHTTPFKRFQALEMRLIFNLNLDLND